MEAPALESSADYQQDGLEIFGSAAVSKIRRNISDREGVFEEKPRPLRSGHRFSLLEHAREFCLPCVHVRDEADFKPVSNECDLVLADRDARGGLLDEVDLQRGLHLRQPLSCAPGEQE